MIDGRHLPETGDNTIFAEVEAIGNTLLIGPDGEGDWHMVNSLVGGTERVEPHEIVAFDLIHSTEPRA